ncbi:hypothetical protein KY284_018796 [Solanum tuberosum]|nr:hypothetical protein KY284_018796 [Solanum tuberosum]
MEKKDTWKRSVSKKEENAKLKDREAARVNNAVFNILTFCVSYSVWFPLPCAFKAHLFIIRPSTP